MIVPTVTGEELLDLRMQVPRDRLEAAAAAAVWPNAGDEEDPIRKGLCDLPPLFDVIEEVLLDEARVDQDDTLVVGSFRDPGSAPDLRNCWTSDAGSEMNSFTWAASVGADAWRPGSSRACLGRGQVPGRRERRG